MSIQPSVIIWTIICFCLFALVLNKLLFRPVLKTMDERKAHIERARADAEAAELRRRELEEQALLEAAEAEAKRAEEYKQQLREYRENAEKELKAHAARLEEAKKETLEAASVAGADAYESIIGSIDGMVDAFTEKLVSGGSR